jgi:hypothetical protein
VNRVRLVEAFYLPFAKAVRADEDLPDPSPGAELAQRVVAAGPGVVCHQALDVGAAEVGAVVDRLGQEASAGASLLVSQDL